MAKVAVPLALLFILAGCGSSKQVTTASTIGIRGTGFAFQAPSGSRVTRRAGAVVARLGSGLVSVTLFPLAKAYDPARFDVAAKALDRVARRLDANARGETVTIDGQKSRSYSYGSKRIGFVLVGKREYQLYCDGAADACDLLFRSFRLTGPQA